MGKKDLRLIFTIAGVHLSLTLGGMALVIFHFGPLTSTTAPFAELFTKNLMIVLCCPFALISEYVADSSILENDFFTYAALGLNSLLWGVAVSWCYTFISRRHASANHQH